MRQKARRFNRSTPLAAFSPGFARVVWSRPQIVRLDHSHCIQPVTRTWPRSVPNRGFVVMAGLAMVCRAGAWGALMVCPAANAAEAEAPPARPAAESHPAAKPACLTAAE